MSFKKLIVLISTILAGSVIFVLVTGSIGWDSIVNSLSQITLWQLVVVFLIQLAAVELSILVWYLALRQQGEKPSYLILRRAHYASFPVSYFTPFSIMGGEVFRLYLAHRESSMSLQGGAISITVERLINFIVFCLFMLVGLAAFFILGGRFIPKLNLVLIPLFGALLFLLFLLFFGGEKRKSLFKKLFHRIGGNKLANSTNGKAAIQYERRVLTLFDVKNKNFWVLFGITVFRHLLLALEVALIIHFLVPGSFGFVSSLIIYSSSSVAVIMSIPADLGTLELVERLSFGLLNIQLSFSVIFSLIWRAVRLLVCILGGIYFLWFTKNMVERKVMSFVNRISHLWKTKE